MSKCGKGCMPECEYFTTGGCISPFNCMYKEESGYSNSATSGKVIYTGGMNMTEKEIIQKIYEVIKLVDCIQYNPSVDFNYLRAKGAYNIIKNQVEHIEAENAALRERLEKAVILPCKVGDTIYEATPVGIREWLVTSIELEDYGFKANCEGKNDFKLHWHFVKTDCCNDFEGKGRIRVTREAAEARCAELKGGKE